MEGVAEGKRDITMTRRVMKLFTQYFFEIAEFLNVRQVTHSRKKGRGSRMVDRSWDLPKGCYVFLAGGVGCCGAADTVVLWSRESRVVGQKERREEPRARS